MDLYGNRDLGEMFRQPREAVPHIRRSIEELPGILTTKLVRRCMRLLALALVNFWPTG